MFKRKNKIQNCDVDAEVAKSNYKKYLDELDKERQEYIKELCTRIKKESRRGCKCVCTACSLEDFMSYDYMMNTLKPYFEQRGFIVTEECNRSGILTSWLKIRWEE